MTTTLSKTRIQLDGQHVYVEDFDYDFIINAIRWAERDEEWLASLTEADRNWWGRWEQGTWGTISVPAEHINEVREAAVDPDDNTLNLASLTDFIRTGYCNTSYCQAGQRVHQAGYRLIYNDLDPDDLASGDSANFCVMQEPTGERGPLGLPVMRDVPGESEESISDVARMLMGISGHESDLYFEADNSPGMLKEYANGMCARRGIPLMWPDEDVYDFEYRDDDPY